MYLHMYSECYQKHLKLMSNRGINTSPKLVCRFKYLLQLFMAVHYEVSPVSVDSSTFHTNDLLSIQISSSCILKKLS